MFNYFLLAFISGALVKIVDELSDKRNKLAAYLFGAAYGIVIGHLISSASFSMLFLGALIAQVVARKIDKGSHMLGFLFAIMATAYFGVPNLEVFPLLVFFALAFLDEQEFKGFLGKITEYRVFLKLGALTFVLFGRVDYLVSVLLFDAAYLVAEKLAERLQKQ